MHPWLIAAANSARTQAAGSSSLSIASAGHNGEQEQFNIAAQVANTQAPGLHAAAGADIHDGQAQHGSGGLDKTVTSVCERLAVDQQQLSNAAVDGAASVICNTQLREVTNPPDDSLLHEAHAAFDEVVRCNNSDAEALSPPKEAFLLNRQCSIAHVPLGVEELVPAKSLLGLLNDPPLQQGSNRAERRAKQKEEKAKASALANAERKKASPAYAARMVCCFLRILVVVWCIPTLNVVLAVLTSMCCCGTVHSAELLVTSAQSLLNALLCVVVLSTNRICVQTPAQLKEDLSEDLAIAQRNFDATRQDLIKKATNFLEVKADQRVQQKAIISNLSQVSLSYTAFQRQTLWVVMAVHLSATPSVMDFTP